jgi:hypothetical protein
VGVLRGCRLLLNHVKSRVLYFFFLVVCISPKLDLFLTWILLAEILELVGAGSD